MPVNSRKSLFWRIYLISVIAAVILLAIGMIVLRVKLREYENSQPEHLAEEIFNKNFSNASAEEITALISQEEYTEEQKAQLLEDVKEALSEGEITYSREATSESSAQGSKKVDDYKKYTVKAGARSIASFTLNKVPGSDRKFLFSILTFKYAKYEFGSIMNELSYSTDGTGKYLITVLAPGGYTVSVDGVQLGEEYIKDSNVELDSVKFTYTLDTLKDFPMKYGIQYVYPSASSQPNVTCMSNGGMPAYVVYDEESGIYRCSFVYDEYLQASYEPLILEAAEIYSRYLTNDASFNTLSYYLDPTSLLYEQTKTTQTGFVIDHNGYEFKDESTSEYLTWADGVFSCRVKLTQLLHKNGSDDYFEMLDKTYFFRIDGTDLLIFDSFNMN